VTSQSIAQASRTLLSGSTVGQFREGDKLIDIVLRQPLSERDAMSDLAQAYVQRGMSAYVEKVQEPEFAARERGYSFVSHQQEVGTGYFDELTTVIQGGRSSVTALTGSTEEEQFH
jgi:isocitrate lyase